MLPPSTAQPVLSSAPSDCKTSTRRMGEYYESTVTALWHNRLRLYGERCRLTKA